MDGEQRLAPGQVLVVDVVRLVVKDHQVLERLEPLQHRRLVGRQILGWLRAEQGVDGVLRRPRLVSGLVELLDVGQEEVAGGSGSVLSPRKMTFWLKGPHSGGISGKLVKIWLLAKSFSRALVHDHVGATIRKFVDRSDRELASCGSGPRRSTIAITHVLPEPVAILNA